MKSACCALAIILSGTPAVSATLSDVMPVAWRGGEVAAPLAVGVSDWTDAPPSTATPVAGLMLRLHAYATDYLSAAAVVPGALRDAARAETMQTFKTRGAGFLDE